MNVVFPAPFAPTNPMMPGGTSRLRLSSATTEGEKAFVRSLVLISDNVDWLGLGGGRTLQTKTARANLPPDQATVNATIRGILQ